MSSPTFEVWGVEESPIRIEYSLVVIEEIRRLVSEGLQRFSRGGLEVGGVLYGTHEDSKVRVTAMRAINCEHKAGPSFTLSTDDRETLTKQLEEASSDPQLADLTCVGWFVSHTRGDLAMTEQDQLIFEDYFKDPWQATLVVRPGRAGSMRAAFFVRERDGAIKADQSYQEFDFPDRLAALFDRPMGGERTARDRGKSEHPPGPMPVPGPLGGQGGMGEGLESGLPGSAFGGGISAGGGTAASRALAQPRPDEDSSGALPGPGRPPFGDAAPGSSVPVDEPLPRSALFENLDLEIADPPRRRMWPWLMVGVLLLALGGAIGWQYFGPVAPPPEPIALVIVERNGELEIEWNPQAGPIAAAVGGRLQIVDGDSPENFPLNVAELSRGVFQYTRQTGTVEVQMIVEAPDGTETREASRFLGRPPAPPEDEQLEELDARRAELEAEVQNLRRQNSNYAAQIQQLQRTLAVLRSRLGIVEGQQ